MGELTDRLLLFLLCFVLSFDNSIGLLSVSAFLMVLCASCVSYYLDRKWFRILYGSAFMLLGIAMPCFAVYLPVVFYDICAGASPIFGVVGFFGCSAGLVKSMDSTSVVLFLLLTLAGITEYRTRKHGELAREFKRLRDTSQELNMTLKKKNKALIDKQEYEIQAATLAERNRIAREIHDNVGHMLSRSILQVGAMLAVNKQESLRQPLLELKNTLNTAMDSIRSSVHDLRDQALILEDAVHNIIKDYKDYQITFEYDMSERAKQQVKYCFLTTLKEALTNTTRHSDADRVFIVMREHPAFYQLLIEDNGTKRSKPVREGMGLANMRERAEALGGTIRITADAGFRIFISLPKQMR